MKSREHLASKRQKAGGAATSSSQLWRPPQSISSFAGPETHCVLSNRQLRDESRNHSQLAGNEDPMLQFLPYLGHLLTERPFCHFHLGFLVAVICLFSHTFLSEPKMSADGWTSSPVPSSLDIYCLSSIFHHPMDPYSLLRNSHSPPSITFCVQSSSGIVELTGTHSKIYVAR